MEDPEPELQAEAAPLIQTAWLAGEYWNALSATRLPDSVKERMVICWYQTTLMDELVPTWESDDE